LSAVRRFFTTSGLRCSGMFRGELRFRSTLAPVHPGAWQSVLQNSCCGPIHLRDVFRNLHRQHQPSIGFLCGAGWETGSQAECPDARKPLLELNRIIPDLPAGVDRLEGTRSLKVQRLPSRELHAFLFLLFLFAFSSRAAGTGDRAIVRAISSSWPRPSPSTVLPTRASVTCLVITARCGRGRERWFCDVARPLGHVPFGDRREPNIVPPTEGRRWCCRIPLAPRVPVSARHIPPKVRGGRGNRESSGG